jgi:cytochrome c553
LNPVWPKLAGQNPKYLEAQLHEFKKGPDGNRNNAVMYGIAMTLSDSDITNLSAYYASLKSSVGLVKDDYLELGRNIYRGGNMDIKMQACMSCHGPMDRVIMLLRFQCYLDNIHNIHTNN